MFVFWIVVCGSVLLVVLSVAWCVRRRKVHRDRVVEAYEKLKDHEEMRKKNGASAPPGLGGASRDDEGDGLVMSSCRRLSAFIVPVDEDGNAIAHGAAAEDLRHVLNRNK